MVTVVRPTTVEELAEVVRAAESVDIVGSGTKAAFDVRPYCSGRVHLETSGLKGVVEHDVSDQVVVVRAGTSLADLQSALAEHGQCLPLPRREDVGVLAAGVPGTVGGLVAMGLPHALQGVLGGPRDWTIGMTVVRPDGQVARLGSKAVKNVAGYDVTRLMVGARGTLAVIGVVIFRTYPLKALPKPVVQRSGEPNPVCATIHRTLRTDFAALAERLAGRAHLADPASSTAWYEGDPVARFAEDWVLQSGAGAANLEVADPMVVGLMRRAKRIFDPANKFNPGAMGVV
ncbi:MAG: FAD-binding protein [Fimbriimonadaceae bacterium]|nr:FAD-binding protein [Fimbriimonadaceae bacterium]